MNRKTRIIASFILSTAIVLFTMVLTLNPVQAIASSNGMSQMLAQEKQDIGPMLSALNDLVPGRDYRAGEVLVQTDSDGEASRIAQVYGASVSSCSKQGLAVLRLKSGQTTAEAVALGASSKNSLPVVYPNFIYQIAECQVSYSPADPNLSAQYHHADINSYAAWEKTRGSADTIVAVIDTGIDTDHPELTSKISALSYNTYTNQAGFYAVNDDQGHGTHVGGIIAAAMNNGQGGCGIAPDCTLLVIKANTPSAPNSFTAADMIEGIYYAADHGADVINMSLGRSYSEGGYSLEQEAIRYAVSQGALVVCAAGNEMDDHAGYPAAYPEVVAVSALVEGGGFASGYSNYGPEIDIAAPGTNIYSTYPDKSFSYLSGTSMACPVVSGVAALVKAYNPELAVDEVKAILSRSATDRGAAGWDSFYGNGEVNAAAAVDLASIRVVTFDSLSGSPVDPAEVGYGSLLPVPADPTRVGCSFAGWYQDAECTVAWDFDTEVVTHDLTLYARWLPDAPSGLMAAATSGISIDLTWTAVSNAAGYAVYRSTTPDGPFVWRKTIATNTIGYADTGLTPETTYYYQVRAYITSGSGRIFSVSSTVASARPALAAPSGVQAASASPGSIKLTWTGVPGAAGYVVYRSTSGSGPFTWAATLAAGARSFTNTGLTINTSYYFHVRAFVLNGNTRIYSGLSAVAAARPTLAVPSGVRAASVSSGSIKLTWTGVPGAAGYVVYHSASGSGPFTWAATLAADARSFTNAGLTINTSYYYRVRAFVLNGNTRIYSGLSAISSARPVPAWPALFSAAASGTGSVNLSWQPVTGASGYAVYRATSANGTYQWIKSLSSTRMTNNGLTSGRYYYYKVRAYQTTGSVRVFGDFSVVKYARAR